MTEKEVLGTKFGGESVSERILPIYETRTRNEQSRKFKLGTLVTILASSLLLSSLTTVSSNAAPSTLGAACSKQGALTNAVASGKLVCLKSGKKLVCELLGTHRHCQVRKQRHVR
jgi:hypothetical protein